MGYVMSEAKTLVTLMLGGVFNGTSGPELGDIDYQINFEEVSALQQELVTSDDVYVDLVARQDFDSQRLRADTAEVELRESRNREYEAKVLLSEQHDKLKAAEQRIAELKAVLERMLEYDDMPVHWFAQRIDAALNPKTEAGSHE